jgi:hypothetical protein
LKWIEDGEELRLTVRGEKDEKNCDRIIYRREESEDEMMKKLRICHFLFFLFFSCE